MQRRKLFLAVVLFFGCFAPVLASDTDPLWTKVIAHNNELKKWAAKNVEQTIVASKDGEPAKTVQIKKQLSGWEKDKPQYTVLSISPPPSDGKKPSKSISLDDMFSSMESDFMSSKAKIKRSDGQTLNGKTVVLFEIEESGAILKIWADAANGLIQKRVLDMSVAFTLEGNLTTTYQTDAKGLSFPAETATKIDIKIPFKKAKVQMRDTYTDWVVQTK